MHKEEKVYVPELIFGHLLTSSNYNDGEKKVCGGTLVTQSAQACAEHSMRLGHEPLLSADNVYLCRRSQVEGMAMVPSWLTSSLWSL